MREAGIQVLALTEIIPYWRNPRVIPDEAVQRTVDSIERYGYQQPIIVDRESVIIAGHTRYAALKRLGWKEVAVIVSDLTGAEANAYRVVDNRSGEYTGWNTELLRSELAKFEETALETFFPNLGELLEGSGMPDLTDADFEKMFQPSGDIVGEVEETLPLTCIHCFEETQVPVSEWLALANRLGE